MLQINKLVSVILIAIVVYGCVAKPYAKTTKVYKKQTKEFAKRIKEEPTIEANDSIMAPDYFVGTTNFSMRKPNFVIIHHTAQKTCDSTLRTFTIPRTGTSAHYVICKEGVVYHMLNDLLRAHHAGNGKWGNVIDMNSCSIGIEIDNDGFQPFTDAQINSLISLLGKLKKDYSIPTANFIGHGDFAPGRKNDPSILFPWQKLADKGFGLWYDNARDTTPANFNHLLALRVIGYNTKDTTAAIRSFKRHFMQDSTKRINDADRNVLNNLMKKY
jgi:N-acetylmuramoyl-L-alanine amidase